jgi:hypothetical protein
VIFHLTATKAKQLLERDFNDLTTGQALSRAHYLDQARREMDKAIAGSAALVFIVPLWALPLYDLFMLRQTFWPLFIGAAGMSAIIATLLIHALRGRRQCRVNLVLARITS